MHFNRLFGYGSVLIGILFCSYANQFWLNSSFLTVSFLDIGQGDSILIETPHGRTVLIDGGPGITLLERLGDEVSFWKRSIDLLILTHPDRDHLEGLVELLPRYRVEKLLMTGVLHDSQLYRTFLERVAEQRIETHLPSPEQDWILDDQVYLDILGPDESVALEETSHSNDTSIIAKLVYRSTTLLLPGDAEALGEKNLLLSDYDLRSEFLKSGHHGSKTSSGWDFLRSVQPKQSVIMSGKDNPFDHPHLETVLRYDHLGMEWWDTQHEGTITFVSDGERWFRK